LARINSPEHTDENTVVDSNYSISIQGQ